MKNARGHALLIAALLTISPSLLAVDETVEFTVSVLIPGKKKPKLKVISNGIEVPFEMEIMEQYTEKHPGLTVLIVDKMHSSIRMAAKMEALRVYVGEQGDTSFYQFYEVDWNRVQGSSATLNYTEALSFINNIKLAFHKEKRSLPTQTDGVGVYGAGSALNTQRRNEHEQWLVNLRAIVERVKRIPTRKNLILISGGFPSKSRSFSDSHPSGWTGPSNDIVGDTEYFNTEEEKLFDEFRTYTRSKSVSFNIFLDRSESVRNGLQPMGRVVTDPGKVGKVQYLIRFKGVVGHPVQIKNRGKSIYSG